MNKPHTNQFSILNGPIDPKSLEDSPEFNEAIDRDFGTALENQSDGFSRRRWLQLMGASLALGGTAGCRFQEEKIAPFAFRPQNRLPGIPEKFATMTELGGVAEPLLATNSDGRPIKLDGNPNHPDSMGGSSTFTQARILEFYDPDRLRAPLHGITESTWDDLVKSCQLPDDLSGVAILAEPTASPSLMRLQSEFSKRGGSWFTFSPLSDDNTRAGSKQAFGTPYRAHYRFDQAKVIVCLDADPLKNDPGNIANSISFFKGRDADNKQMSRMYSVESQYSTTGASADHRISVPSSKIAGFAAALAKAIDGDGSVDVSLPYRERVLAAMASDLLKHRDGGGIIIAGERQPPEVHALVHHLNAKLGNLGKTIQFAKLPDPDRPAAIDSIKKFAGQLQSGDFKTVIVLGGNPVYGAPSSLNLAELIAEVDNSIHISSYKNETSLACKWTSAMAHPLESWKDGFSNDGSILVGQPLINPLFDGKSDLETLSILMGSKTISGQSIVRETLQLNETEWQQAVHDGFVADSASGFESPTAGAAPAIAADESWSKKWDNSSLEIVFTPSLSVYDGRFANNSWLQELPDFFTKVTWDNVASVSPRTAEALGLKQFGMASNSASMLMTITFNGVTMEIPVGIQPGQADGSIGLALGYGRTMAGRVGGDVENGIDPVGHDVSVLRDADDWWFAKIGNDAAKPTGTTHRLAIVQEPWAIDDVGRGEIQARMFRDYSKKESDRSGLLREGSFKSYEEFLLRHPIESHDSAQVAPGTGGQYATGKNGSLPLIHPVSYTVGSPVDEDASGQEESESHHAATWPEAFHMHHELFDLTKGTREDYKAENPSHTNVWGMAIDLNKCFGCNSCVISCQSENNIPVVGKAEVWRGREMHWIRIDRYYGDNLYTEDAKDDDKQLVHQPVACHHCENAPCENVCPVAATVHSSEGLNDMVYNRCIGTRYCGNNCPYKVRRFNFFNYSDAVTLVKYPDSNKLPPGDLQLQNLMMNPEVTIRSRGVMEKCTYCVQRIQNTKIQAKNEHRDIGPNEIRTACQDACPTSAITFGDLNKHGSDVREAHANPRAYTMLEELNNRPRTKYLARVRNLHKDLTSFDDRDSLGSHGHGSDDHAAGDENHDHEGGNEGGPTKPANEETEAAH